ncbi:hypothetical protein [Micromonospora sp. U21]|uniref:hypothetical protein n=1 Tax=Micromonospora sp. U21 TaxID=2824899 RepID=UPI001B373458|nr:hypothetical protein [Micromonospora sp. U21]MBQ0901315.1 hypothetical protein [Micromonospora sp. U21]
MWLIGETRWKVIARAGDTETGKVLRWEFESEPEAFAWPIACCAPTAPGSGVNRAA